ncbi:hypothetical protein BCR33DRAFT_861388 [Rhizoclosmatium globosum]|uniref:Uncharacterized protein n=1 Tax=Rhizoclosmatium globosum TaxID=329046 RepID=A0A1Y2AIX9_9FUNG|nr:hypothetical protein BCR33DRAFT_861388 [Rhizoclosmatium globosum]|eukprot:ORY22521.1 hypothetical protein BCR33DRAFT_861388 [Rhizoclosmatium globosum]
MTESDDAVFLKALNKAIERVHSLQASLLDKNREIEEYKTEITSLQNQVIQQQATIRRLEHSLANVPLKLSQHENEVNNNVVGPLTSKGGSSSSQIVGPQNSPQVVLGPSFTASTAATVTTSASLGSTSSSSSSDSLGLVPFFGGKRPRYNKPHSHPAPKATQRRIQYSDVFGSGDEDSSDEGDGGKCRVKGCRRYGKKLTVKQWTNHQKDYHCAVVGVKFRGRHDESTEIVRGEGGLLRCPCMQFSTRLTTSLRRHAKTCFGAALPALAAMQWLDVVREKYPHFAHKKQASYDAVYAFARVFRDLHRLPHHAGRILSVPVGLKPMFMQFIGGALDMHLRIVSGEWGPRVLDDEVSSGSDNDSDSDDSESDDGATMALANIHRGPSPKMNISGFLVDSDDNDEDEGDDDDDAKRDYEMIVRGVMPAYSSLSEKEKVAIREGSRLFLAEQALNLEKQGVIVYHTGNRLEQDNGNTFLVPGHLIGALRGWLFDQLSRCFPLTPLIRP